MRKNTALKVCQGVKAVLLMGALSCMSAHVFAKPGDGADTKKLAAGLVSWFQSKTSNGEPVPLYAKDAAVTEQFIVWLNKWDDRFADSLSARLSGKTFTEDIFTNIFHQEAFHLWRRFNIYTTNKEKFRLSVSPYNDARLDAVAQKMEVFYFEIYPLIYERYHKKDAPDAPQVNIRFDPNLQSNPAYTSNDTITLSSDWFIKHPDDIGAFTHEMTHLLQKYYNRAPGWMVEGMSDYIRYVYQGIAHEQFALPGSMKGRSYRDAYRVTAKFFVWLNTLSPGFTDYLHQDLFLHRYSPDIFTKRFGASLDDLWKQFAAENDSHL